MPASVCGRLHAPLGAADEEDAASRAFTKVCRGIESGQLKLASRVDFTRVLRSATAREVFTLLGRAKTAGGRPDNINVLGQIPDLALPPDLLLLAFDACQRLLDLLETDELRQVAVWKLAGHTNEAIAVKLCRSPPRSNVHCLTSEKPGGERGATPCQGDRRSPAPVAAPRQPPMSPQPSASMTSRSATLPRSSRSRRAWVKGFCFGLRTPREHPPSPFPAAASRVATCPLDDRLPLAYDRLGPGSKG